MALVDLIHGLPIMHESLWSAGLSKHPTTPGQHVIILQNDNLFHSTLDDFRATLCFVRDYAKLVKSFYRVRRCGLAYDGHRTIHIIPMHGLSEEWAPMMAEEVATTHSYPGYLWTKSSPPIPENLLDAVQHQLIAASHWHQPDHNFLGDPADTNIFAKLVRGEIPQWRIWEDERHVGFLTPFGNVPGFTVVIPRRHLSSDILSLDTPEFLELVCACRHVALVLMAGMKTTRTGMFFEGFEIDYAHAKLLPVLDDQAHPEGPSDEFHETYPGYLTTRLGPASDSRSLDEMRAQFQSFIEASSLPAQAGQ